jgi:uncharacterized membrane protein
MDKTTLIKTLTWRAIAVSITFGVTYVVTGSIEAAGAIGAVNSVFKMTAYYAHERAWSSYILRKAQGQK